MAWTKVYEGDAGVYLYVEYSFNVNASARTWICNAALKVHVTESRTIGPWDNTNANSATLQGGGIGSLNNTNYTLVAAKQVGSGTYNSAGDAPSVNVSWCWNVNSSWGGFVNPYGTVKLTGSSLATLVAPTAPTRCVIDAGHGNYIVQGERVNVSWSGATGTITKYQTQWYYNGTWNSTITDRTGTSFSEVWSNAYAVGKTIKYRVRACNGSVCSAWKESNELTIVDSLGGMNIKVDGAWKKGRVFIKDNGVWKPATGIYIKVNGEWKRSV